MIRLVLSSDRLFSLEPEGEVRHRYGQSVRDQETMDYLESIARMTSHIPDKGQLSFFYPFPLRPLAFPNPTRSG